MHETFARQFLSHPSEFARRFGHGGSASGANARDAEEAAQFAHAFGEGEASSPSPLEAWGAALSPVSSALLRGFAARLGAFAESSPEYMRRNFIENRADIESSGERLSVRFHTCPLQMVLRMAGFDHSTWVLDWLGRRELAFRFD